MDAREPTKKHGGLQSHKKEEKGKKKKKLTFRNSNYFEKLKHVKKKLKYTCREENSIIFVLKLNRKTCSSPTC